MGNGESHWGWVAGLQEENQDLGVICPAPQSPVGEEGEGRGREARLNVKYYALFRIFQWKGW